LACDKRANEGPEVEVISSDLAWWHEFLTVWNSVSLLAVLGGTGADSHCDIRCFRTVGLWGLLEFSLVPADLEQYDMYGRGQHPCKGVDPNCDGSSCAWKGLGRAGGMLAV